MARATVLKFRSLTIRLAAREDLITLKLWAASAPSRGPRRKVDIKDLKEIAPTREELQEAVRWCAATDGRPDMFELELASIVSDIGYDPDDFRRE